MEKLKSRVLELWMNFFQTYIQLHKKQQNNIFMIILNHYINDNAMEKTIEQLKRENDNLRHLLVTIYHDLERCIKDDKLMNKSFEGRANGSFTHNHVVLKGINKKIKKMVDDNQ